MKRNDIRNVAVIAHVDHGKTTLVDQMLRQSGLFRSEELDKLVGGQHGLIIDLFIELGATDEQANFPVIYASGRNGIATTDLAVEPKDLRPLFDAILNNVPAPDVDDTAPLQMQVAALQYSEYVGKIVVGR